jgi:hypothetical protein
VTNYSLLYLVLSCEFYYLYITISREIELAPRCNGLSHSGPEDTWDVSRRPVRSGLSIYEDLKLKRRGKEAMARWQCGS